MEREWTPFITQKELNGAAVVAIRTSDNVLDEEDWPVHILKFSENGICTRQIVENKGVYTMNNFVDQNLHKLVEWSNSSPTGPYDKTFYDLCVLIYF